MGARSSEVQLLSTVLSVVAPASPQGVQREDFHLSGFNLPSGNIINSYLLHTVSLKVPGLISQG